ncbi:MULTISPECIES: type IVa pilus pseudopilin TppE [Aeromonas]|jgi:type IV fimbrial biogenesis protein FimT|uniref:Type II secretion system protein H n=1 Tax=Aeromonas bestiarum TaxID=105751 RepID=A0ABT7Q0X8_9GAMM|nr:MULTISPECIES: type IVa pilus pseudopilin TppE [Aeromonas]EKP0277809.1 type IVa pilus pseudopilin TppE [Aeromonas bestiarum]KFN17742.1 type IV pilin [Aeromonas bestiarum]MCH7348420.1 type IVa pilus pseudopilin TppE [Aeromonas sp. MR7]MDM5072983.1 type IVa pilus pseudopilin TppE [Aeromonas bestiarum]MDM5090351.1 type IVa pilus pseudopilin TppE [Aeromonas bestiarum]
MFLRSGFSLIELMVTIAIVSILLTLGVPSFSAVLRNITLTTQANNFVAAINLARSEAIRRNTAVTLSATASNITQHHWESGWQIWVDSNGNGTLDNGELLRLFPDMGSGTLVSNTSLLRFSGNGFLDGRQQVTLVFSLQPPDCAAEPARDIMITPAGRPSIQETSCI